MSMRRLLRRACCVSVGLASVAFVIWYVWPTSVCPLNPTEPDAQHPYHVTVWGGRGGGGSHCYVSASDLHAYSLTLIALGATVTLAVVMGVLTRRYPPTPKT